MVTTHAFHLISNIFITQSHSSILPTCFTSTLEPASYVTQNSLSELLIPLSATFIWTCQFNLLHTAITFHHFFTVSLWAQNLLFQKILTPSSPRLSLFLSFGPTSWLYTVYWIYLLIGFYVLVLVLFLFSVIATCGRLSLPALRVSTFGRTIKSYWLIDCHFFAGDTCVHAEPSETRGPQEWRQQDDAVGCGASVRASARLPSVQTRQAVSRRTVSTCRSAQIRARDLAESATDSTSPPSTFDWTLTPLPFHLPWNTHTHIHTLTVDSLPTVPVFRRWFRVEVCVLAASRRIYGFPYFFRSLV